MLKIIKKAISGSNNANNVGSQQHTSNEHSPVQNNNNTAYQSTPSDNTYLENQYSNQSHGQYNTNGLNSHYNATSYSANGFNPNTIRKSSKTSHSDTGSFSLSESLPNHQQSRSISIAHRNNGYNSPVACQPQSNMNFSTTPQSSPNTHQIHMPVTKHPHQFYTQNQTMLTKQKTVSNDIEFYEQQLKVSQQKYQELESQFKNQNEQIKDLKSTIQSVNDMNHKFYDEIQHLKERNMDQRKQIDSFNKLFQDCKQDSERKLGQIRQEFEQSLKREMELKKMIQQIQENKNQEISNLKDKLEKAKLVESEQNSEIEKRRNEIQSKTDKIETLEKSIRQIENELSALKDNTLSEKKTLLNDIETLKSNVDTLNKQIEDERSNHADKSKAERAEQKKHIDELESKLEEVIKEKAEITCKYGQILDRNKELNDLMKSNDENNEKALKESRNQLDNFKSKCSTLERELSECRELHSREKEEWKKFQADLQTAVRVANDFMNEAEEKYNRIRDEIILNSKDASLVLESDKFRKESKVETLAENLSCTKLNCDKKLSTSSSSESTSSSDSNRVSKNLMESIEFANSFQTNTDTDDAKLLSYNQINNGQYSFPKRVSTTSNDSSPLLASFDSLSNLVKQYGVSKRNALMKWCQERLVNYDVEIKNFSSSWNDGLAFCAIMHSFMPDKIEYEALRKEKNVRKRLSAAFSLAESIGIEQKLNINDILNQDRPDWNEIMNYVALIYTHFNKRNSNTSESDNSESTKSFSTKSFESPRDKSYSSAALSVSNSSSNISNMK